MIKFIATFGSGHLGGFGLHYYVEVNAPDERLARLMLNKAFEGHWSSIYKSDWFFDNYAMKYGTINRLGILDYSHHSDAMGDIYYENRVV